jgi:hypothetical protein
VALVSERTVPTEWRPFVGEVLRVFGETCCPYLQDSKLKMVGACNSIKTSLLGLQDHTASQPSEKQCQWTATFHVLLNSMAWVRERTIPTERPPLVGEVIVNFFADRGCHVVTVTDPYCRILGFIDRSRYFFYQVAPQLYSRGWVDPVPEPLLFFLVVPGIEPRASGSVAKNSDH